MSWVYPRSYKDSILFPSGNQPKDNHLAYHWPNSMPITRNDAPHTRNDTRSPRQQNKRRGNKTKKQITSRSKSAPPFSAAYAKFDPLKDLHLWTMWRIGATEKIIKEIQIRERGQGKGVKPLDRFGSALKRPPEDLAKHIRVTEATRRRALDLMDSGSRFTSSELLTKQFIYFGLPRIYVKNHNNT